MLDSKRFNRTWAIFRLCGKGCEKSFLASASVEGRISALRENGATPTQTKVGIELALGKTKPAIANELGVQLSSVADLTRRLYQSLDIHNSAELGMKIWLGQRQNEARQILRRAG